MGYEELVLKALRNMLITQRGQMCVFRLKKVVKMCGLELSWFNIYMVREVLEKLRSYGLIDLYSSKKRIRYIITRKSPLWEMLTSEEPPVSLSEVYARLEKSRLWEELKD